MGMGKMPDVVNGYKWELYNIAEDYSENNDLAAKMPDKLRDMQELFLVEASKYNVFPLDNEVLARALTRDQARLQAGPYSLTRGKCLALPGGSAASTLGKSYSITAEVEIPPGGAEGMINTNGGRFGGYGLYLVKGKPVFTYVQLTTERFRWEVQTLSRPASTPSYLTSNTTAPVSAKAAPARCRWTAKQSSARRCHTPFRSSLVLTRLSTSEWIPAREWMTATTCRRSDLPANSIS